MQFDNEMSFDYKENALSTPKSEDVRLFFSIGKRDKLNAKTLVKFIVDRAKVNGSKINKIDILENFSFVSVEPDISKKVITKCSGIKLNGRRVNIEVATKRK